MNLACHMQTKCFTHRINWIHGQALQYAVKILGDCFYAMLTHLVRLPQCIRSFPYEASAELHKSYLDYEHTFDEKNGWASYCTHEVTKRPYQRGDIVQLNNGRKGLIFKTGIFMDIRAYNPLTVLVYMVQEYINIFRKTEKTDIGSTLVRVGNHVSIAVAKPYTSLPNASEVQED